MNLEKIIADFNKLLQLAESDQDLKRLDGKVRQMPGSRLISGDPHIAFIGNWSIAEEIIYRLHGSDPDLQYYPMKNFIADILECLRKKIKAKISTLQRKEVQSFFTQIKEQNPKQNLSVWAPISGINSSNTYRKIGKFKIYHRVFDLELIQQLPKSDVIFDTPFWEHTKTFTHFISTDVSARNNNEAINMAAEHFKEFEWCVKFILGNVASKYHIHVGPIDFNNQIMDMIVSKEGVSFSYSFELGPLDLELDDIANDYDTLWDIICKPEKDKIEKRIYNAIMWIGKALEDKERSRSFIQLMMSLESLLQYDPNDQIRPGITHQLSEYVAFLLSSDGAERKDLFDEVKNYYGIRSAIVHGGNKDIDDVTIKRLVSLCREAVNEIFQKYRRKEIVRFEDFHKWVEDQKFSG